MSIELTMAGDAQFTLTAPDHEVNAFGDIEPGQECMVITSMDGEGVGIIGSLQEIRDVAAQMVRYLDIEIEEEEKKDAVPADQGGPVAGEDPDPEVAPEPVRITMGQFSDVEYDEDDNPVQKEAGK